MAGGHVRWDLTIPTNKTVTGVASNSTRVPVALNADAAGLPTLEEPLPPRSG